MDEARFLTMTRKELNRLEILGRVLDRRLTQVQAAEQLGLSVRQVARLCRKLRVEGPAGLVSQKRGLTSNRVLPSELRERNLDFVRSPYPAFGPTLAAGAKRRPETRGAAASTGVSAGKRKFTPDARSTRTGRCRARRGFLRWRRTIIAWL